MKKTQYEGKKDLEKSIEELSSYTGFFGDLNQEKYNNIDSLSFRPINLPRKTPQEEQFHKKLVEDIRAQYLNKLKEKQTRNETQQKENKENEKKQNELNEIWKEQILLKNIRLNNNDKLKKNFYQGIPDSLRGKIWAKCLGNSFSISKEYYEIQVKRSKTINKKIEDNNFKNINFDNSENSENSNKENTMSIIYLDIERTFPYLGIYKSDNPMNEDLKEILMAFVACRPDIGYIQGLSFIAGMLRMQMDKFNAFTCFINLIISPEILPFFLYDTIGINKRISIFKELFSFNLPQLYKKFEDLEILPEYYFIEWIMTLFSKSLSIELTKRIWDIYFYEGIITIYSASIVLLSHFEKNFLLNEFEEILKQLKLIYIIKFDTNEFISAIPKIKYTDKIKKEIENLSDDNIPI